MKEARDLSEAELDEMLANNGVLKEQETTEKIVEPEKKEVIKSEEISEDIEEILLADKEKEKEPIIEKGAEKGLRKDLIAERDRRRKAEEEMSMLKARLAVLEQSPKINATQPSITEPDDDDVVSYREMKKVYKKTEELEQTLNRQQELLAEKERRIQEKHVQNCENEVRTKYSADKVGEEFAYENLLAEVIIPMLEKSPKLHEILRESDNPAEMAYRIALSQKLNPDRLLKKTVIAKPQQSVKKSETVTLGSIPAGGGASEEISLENINIDDLSEDNLNKLLKKMR